MESPGTYPGWPDPEPSGPRTGWVPRPSTSCLGGWLQTGCSRYLRRGCQEKHLNCCCSPNPPSLWQIRAWGGRPSHPGPLTFQEADSGLRELLHQPPHEELGTKELRADEGPVLGKADFIGRELTPFCEHNTQLRHGARDPGLPDTHPGLTLFQGSVGSGRLRPCYKHGI